MLFTQQIEHTLILDNKTDFNDTLFDPIIGQRQTRLKVKGKKTANWQGKFHRRLYYPKTMNLNLT